MQYTTVLIGFECEIYSEFLALKKKKKTVLQQFWI